MTLDIGTVLLHRTCDEIRIDLNGNTEGINEHMEHYVIEDITSKTYNLYNLDRGNTWRIEKEKMKYYLQGNPRYNIAPMFEISNEKA